jgi:hypothetical protein
VARAAPDSPFFLVLAFSDPVAAAAFSYRALAYFYHFPGRLFLPF